MTTIILLLLLLGIQRASAAFTYRQAFVQIPSIHTRQPQRSCSSIVSTSSSSQSRLYVKKEKISKYVDRSLGEEGGNDGETIAADKGSSNKNNTDNNRFRNPARNVAAAAGESALRQVQWLGSRVAAAERSEQLRRDKEARVDGRYNDNSARYILSKDSDIVEDESIKHVYGYEAADQLVRLKQRSGDNDKVDGTGGSTFSKNKRQLFVEEQPKDEVMKNMGPATTNKNVPPKMTPKDRQVWEALASLEADMQLLDRLAGQRPQLSAVEFTLLVSAVAACVSGPLVWGGQLAEFLAPSAAALTAAIGIGAEYVGKVAVADGKEVAAASIQCAAEAEGYLANAERAKAITPLCVGIGATSATLALLVPVLLDTIASGGNLQLATEIYLCCPLVGVLAAAVAGLALQETRSFCNMAIGVGNRRFARSGLVGRTWLSTTELIDRKSTSASGKWTTFSLSVLPAPLIGVLIPGALPTKTIVVAALAAAQSAWFLARCEYILSRATDAVALKARSAAVCDTYANQGARSAAILPFTSALSGLCAAATAAIVELPFLEALAESGTPQGTALEVLTISAFPAFSALFAAAASVSKARCEVDAEAAMQAASTMALPYDDEDDDPILRPISGVWELIKLTVSSIRQSTKNFFRRLGFKRRFRNGRFRRA